MLNRFSKLFLVGITALSAMAAVAQTGPDPRQVQIRRLSYAGPGCPSGSVAHNLAFDAQAFTVLFDRFNVEVGPSTPGGRANNSCRLTVDLRFPQGWTYSVFTVDYRGYMSLDAGVTGIQRSKYYYQASPNNFRTFSRQYQGPRNEDYSVRDQLTLSQVIWSPCGETRALNIDTEIELANTANPSASGFITVDSIDGELTQIYGIQWQRCP